MTITLKIDNSDIEKELKEFIKGQKEITLEALNKFINSFKKEDKIIYNKKDPKKHSHKIEYIDIDNEDLSDVKPYHHIQDSGEYIHNLRQQRR